MVVFRHIPALATTGCFRVIPALAGGFLPSGVRCGPLHSAIHGISAQVSHRIMATYTGLTMVFIIHGYIGHFIIHPAIMVALIGITIREEAVVVADKREEE